MFGVVASGSRSQPEPFLKRVERVLTRRGDGEVHHRRRPAGQGREAGGLVRIQGRVVTDGDANVAVRIHATGHDETAARVDPPISVDRGGCRVVDDRGNASLTHNNGSRPRPRVGHDGPALDDEIGSFLHDCSFGPAPRTGRHRVACYGRVRRDAPESCHDSVIVCPHCERMAVVRTTLQPKTTSREGLTCPTAPITTAPTHTSARQTRRSATPAP